MAKPIDVPVRIKLDQNISGTLKALANRLQNIKVSDNVSKDIQKGASIASAEVQDLQDQLSKMSKTKVNVASFQAIKQRINDLESTVTSLETRMQQFATILADAGHASSFESMISSLNEDLKQLQNNALETAESIQKISDATNGKAQIQLYNDADIKKSKANLKELSNELKSLKSKGEVDSSATLDNFDLSGTVKKYNDAVDQMEAAQKKLSKITVGDSEWKNTFSEFNNALSNAKKASNTYDKIQKLMYPQDDDDQIAGIEIETSKYAKKYTNIVSKVKSQVQKQINQITESVDTTTAPSTSNASQNKLSIDVGVSTTPAQIQAKINKIVQAAQNSVKGKPVQIEIELSSKTQSKKFNSALKQFQDNINNLDDESARSQMQDVADNLEKSYGYDITSVISKNFKNIQSEINGIITSLRQQLSKNPIEIPDIKLSDDAIAKAKSQIDDLTKQLQNEIENGAVKATTGQSDNGIYKKISESIKQLETIKSSLSSAGDELYTSFEPVSAQIDKIISGFTNLSSIDIGTSKIDALNVSLNSTVESLEKISTMLDISNTANSATSQKEKSIDVENNQKGKVEADISNINNAFSDTGINVLSSSLSQVVGQLSQAANKASELSVALKQAFSEKPQGLNNLKESVNGIDTDQLSSLLKNLTDISQVLQKFTGITPTSSLDSMFQDINKQVRELSDAGIKLNTKAGKQAGNNIVAQLDQYTSLGGTKQISDMTGVAKNLSKYLTKHVGAKTDESSSLNETSSATQKAISSTQALTSANSTVSNSVEQLVSGLTSESQALNNINNAISNLGVEKMQGIINNLQQLVDLLNTDVNENGIVKSIENISQAGEHLQTLAKVLSSPTKDLQKAKETLGVDSSNDILNNDIKNVSEQSKAFLQNYGQVVAATVQQNSKGALQLVGVVKNANNELEQITSNISTDDSGKYLFNNKKIESGTAALQKQLLQYEKVKQAFDKLSAPTPDTTSQITFDKYGNSEQFQSMLAAAKQYTSQIGQIQKISRQVRQDNNGELRESFSFWGDTGHVTMGRELDMVASSQQLTNVEQLSELIQKLTQNRREYNDLMKSMATNGEDSMTKTQIARIQQLQGEYQKLGSTMQNLKADLGSSNLAQSMIDQFKNQSTASLDTEISKQIENIQNRIQKANQSRANQLNGFTPQYEERLKNINTLIDHITSVQAKHTVGDLYDESELTDIYQDFKKIQGVIDQIGSNNNILAKMSDVNNLLSKVSKDINQNALTGSLRERYQDLQSYLTQIANSSQSVQDGLASITRIDFGNLNGEFKQLHAQMQATGQSGKSFFQQFSTSIKSQSANFLAQYFSLQDIIRYTQTLAQNVVTINSALTELQKVSDASNSRIAQSFDTSAQTAQQLGATVSEVISDTADWSRLNVYRVQ